MQFETPARTISFLYQDTFRDSRLIQIHFYAYYSQPIFVCLCFFSEIFCSRVLFLANPDCVSTRPLFSHFVTNLVWLAGQPIQIFFRPRFFFVLFQIFYVFLRQVNPVGGNCMMTKASLQRGRWQDGSVLGMTTSPTANASTGLMMPIVLRYL
jgi:hypothetical protein